MEVSVHIWVPRYASEKRPHGLIPPSPPAERRAEKRRELARLVRYPVSGRVLLPGMPQYAECLEAARIGTPGAMSGGMQSLSGVDTGLYGSNISTDWTGITAYWKFDEAAGGPYLDATGRGNTLSAVGSPTQATGHIGSGKAIGCSSGTNYASRASTADLTAGAGFTICGWFYWSGDSGDGNAPLVYKGGAYFTALEYTLRKEVHGVNTLSFIVSSDGSTRTQVNTPGILINTWQLMSGRYDGTNLYVGVNAVENNNVYSGGIWSGGQTYVLCKLATFSEYMDGSVDGLAVFGSTAITPTVLTSIYNGGSGKDYPD